MQIDYAPIPTNQLRRRLRYDPVAIADFLMRRRYGARRCK